MKKINWKNKLRTTFCLLSVITLLSTFSGCNEENDVIGIFTGKTWKLSYIAIEGNNKMYDFWGGNQAASETSFSLLAIKDNFTLTFEGQEITTSIGGTFNGRATNPLDGISGKWNANKENGEMQTSGVKSGKETDVLAIRFNEALRSIYSYKGSDEHFLYLYYKDKSGKNFYLAFSPYKKK